MAGVFVLLGLTGTMLKLDGVVAIVGKLTQNEQLDSGEFLNQMGELMGGIEYAFLNSILGVVLMIVFMVFLSLVHRTVSRECI